MYKRQRLILFIFPNVFEFWFLGITLLFLLKSNITNRKIIIVLVVTTLLKMTQEYILHVWKVLDNYRAIDVLNSFLDWFR